MISLLTPAFRILLGGLATILVDIFRRKSNIEKDELRIRKGKQALEIIDQIIIGTVGYIEQNRKKYNDITNDVAFEKAHKIINDSISIELRKDALISIRNLDLYIARGIENAVLNIKINKKGGEK